jgi:hypothetical protein
MRSASVAFFKKILGTIVLPSIFGAVTLKDKECRPMGV